MNSNEQNLKQQKPILVKEEGIIKTYMSPMDGKEFTVLGEIAPNLINEQVKKFKGIIYWSNDMSLSKQVGVLKKICPLITSVPNGELLNIIEGTSEWEFGVFLPEEAEELITKAEQNKLNISIVELK
ncbi:hypothetical protein [Tepidibacter hydrothermalis]|uniref:Uncharacterized protein n=1 Tax=Tepidibacter hydrothermalis TaxID=3036126 RepID=A0ABY8E7U4_9FIRM|nr:hypothetical protein [Tepidibacter hydrothermalis]WFD08960.1 hypothetical protein P4S50_11230 [Tepidibacter hydrothermalis]